MKIVLTVLLFAASCAAQTTTVTPSETPLATGTGSLVFGDPSTSAAASEVRTVSATLVAGKLEIVRRMDYIPNAVPAIGCISEGIKLNGTPCDWTVHKVWKEIYGVKDGKLVLLEKIDGQIVPAKAEQIVFER